MKRLLVFLTMTLLLTSCGGGGGNSVSTFQTPTFTAYYVDAPVKGLIYEASPSGLNGVTDERGAFNFKLGDHVSFYIDPVNRIYIGKVQPVNGQIVNPTIDNFYDAEVDQVIVTLILFALDKASFTSSFMDLSGLLLNTETVNKIKNILARKEMPNQISDVWQSMQSLQADITNYTFKNSGINLNTNNFIKSSFDSVESLDNLTINIDDFSGVYVFNYAGINNFHLNFLSNGIVDLFDDDEVSIYAGTFLRNESSITIRWDRRSDNQCDTLMSLKKRGQQWSLVNFQYAKTPLGCTQNELVAYPYRSLKISSATSVSSVSGKRLQIPVRGVCTLGEGSVVFNISSGGPLSDQRTFTMPASVCNGNTDITGTVSESGIPGLLIFEFDIASPRAKLLFSVSEQSGRAITQFILEKTAPWQDSDTKYSTETSFILD